MKIIQWALYAGFGAYMASIGHPLNVWQFWVAMAFLVAVDLTSYVKGMSR